MLRGKLEDGREPGLGHVGRYRATRELRVQPERAFHVHGKGLGQAAVENLAQHVGPHAVAVHLDGQTVGPQVVQERQQAVVGRGFAARDHDAVQPGSAPFQEAAHIRAEQHGMVLGPPGQIRVVAGGAAQVASAQKQDAAGAPRPVAEAKGRQPAQVAPGVLVICHTLMSGAQPRSLTGIRVPAAGRGWPRAGLLARPNRPPSRSVAPVAPWPVFLWAYSGGTAPDSHRIPVQRPSRATRGMLKTAPWLVARGNLKFGVESTCTHMICIVSGQKKSSRPCNSSIGKHSGAEARWTCFRSGCS